MCTGRRGTETGMRLHGGGRTSVQEQSADGKKFSADFQRDTQQDGNTAIGNSSGKAQCSVTNSRSLQVTQEQSAKMGFKVLNVVWGFTLSV